MANTNIAFVFPGQGSQQVGMLATEKEKFTEIAELFRLASDILDYDLAQIILEGPAETLNQTIHTQPAMLVADIALWTLWRKQKGFMPALMAGHSLGEYAALVAADAISFEGAIKLVSRRAHLMQDAIQNDAVMMAAIVGLDKKTILSICELASQQGIVEAANFNSPTQTVISGQQTAVMQAIELSKAAGARLAKPLNVSIPSHCSMMKTAATKLQTYLNGIKIEQPSVPIIHNATGKPCVDVDQIRDVLVKQLYSSVQWVDTIRYMREQGIDTVIECGPGKVLTGLNKAIDANLKLVTIKGLLQNNLDI
ncbi:MAG: [acyl-carrier-protein] S-malonyltransferase [Gammaproteobacteria bacterium RIFCSPHIGHO2_02_FULL_42_13]|nr:MAG: [acyl-carrier-protein] S-malonyltransferase [Gammaproteobacteria bacterium RIFCSPHIGHO2_02_FULL_42_13]OGT68559.1 MAG: [acyl-carrier-protein] S-malonyltransferase [Gammaproteobacteria bacterium RIFCSPLOWO2_02_FULL_42_9]